MKIALRCWMGVSAVLLVCSAEAQVSCRIDLTPPTVAPGGSVSWSVVVEDSASGSLGLGGFTVNLVQSPSNPSPLAIGVGTLPVSMSGFSRPAGVCNPAPGGGSAYGGTLIASPTGGTDLAEVGGSQNTFGVPLGSIGTDTAIEVGVARSAGGIIVASGVLTAPSTPGDYCIDLANGAATVISSVASSGNPSFVLYTQMSLLPGACFTVTAPPTCDTIDFNQDTLFPDVLDVEDFLSVFGGGPCSNDPLCNDIDFNNDMLFPDVLDIESFLSVFSGGPCL